MPTLKAETVKAETVPLRSDADVVRARQLVRQWAVGLKFTLIDQTKIVTAASEIARNTVVHAGGGTVRLEAVSDGTREGLRLVFEDKGPGIADIDTAMRDGFTTGGGLGLGLGGAKRLSNEFSVESRVGYGTRIVLARWRG
jgi:serine/threonine-protein kinase RsbT